MATDDLAYYDRSGLWGPGSGYDSSRQRDRVADVRAALPSDIVSILDVGCGDGTITNQLVDEYDVMAVDPAEEPLKHVRAPTRVASVEELPFADRGFDAVLLMEVLEHLPTPALKKAREEVTRVADKVVLITVPNREQLGWASVRCPRCRRLFHPTRHYQSFSPSDFPTLFPDFECDMVREIGDLKTRVWRWQSALARPLKRPEPLWYPVVCPNCGAEGRGSRARRARIVGVTPLRRWRPGRALDYGLRRSQYWLRGVARPNPRPRWLMGRFRRVSNSGWG